MRALNHQLTLRVVVGGGGGGAGALTPGSPAAVTRHAAAGNHSKHSRCSFRISCCGAVALLFGCGCGGVVTVVAAVLH